MKASRQIVVTMNIGEAKLLKSALEEEVARIEELMSQNEGKIMLSGSYLHTTYNAVSASHKMSLMIEELKAYI
jgi:hypothetical protein